MSRKIQASEAAHVNVTAIRGASQNPENIHVTITRDNGSSSATPSSASAASTRERSPTCRSLSQITPSDNATSYSLTFNQNILHIFQYVNHTGMVHSGDVLTVNAPRGPM